MCFANIFSQFLSCMVFFLPLPFAVLGIELKALCVLDKCGAAELQPSPIFVLLPVCFQSRSFSFNLRSLIYYFLMDYDLILYLFYELITK